MSISGFVWAQKRVTVVVDGHDVQVKSQASTVGGVLDEAEIPHRDGDIVTPPVDTEITAGMTVVVRHAVPVTLDLAGERMDLDVVGETVADALVAAGTDPSANPAVTPSLTTKLKPGMTITAPEVFVRVTQEQVIVPFVTETQPDPTMPKGKRRVVAPGAPGSAIRVFRVLVTDGVEGAPQLTAEQVVSAPVSEVVALGTGGAPTIAASVSARAPKHGKRMRFSTTGYAAGSGGADNWTATGRRATRGVVAVDPKVIPLGTRLFIPGYGYAIAADTGGAIRGHRIDLCFDSRDDAIRWGRRTVTVVILD